MVRPAAYLTDEAWSRIHKVLDCSGDEEQDVPAEARPYVPSKRLVTVYEEIDWPVGPCVYFIGTPEGPVKIGFTTNVNKRLPTIQVSSPVRLKVLAILPGSRVNEGGLHVRFARQRLHGEWFSMTDEMLALIGDLRAACSNEQVSHRYFVKNNGNILCNIK
jgi:hypothetical protein